MKKDLVCEFIQLFIVMHAETINEIINVKTRPKQFYVSQNSKNEISR